MKTFKVINPLYLTFLTPQDSYMEKIEVGKLIEVDDQYINVYYNGKESIDYFCYIHKHLEEIRSNG